MNITDSCVGLLSLVIAKSPSFGSMIPGSVGGCFDSEALFSRFDRWVCDDHLSTQHLARSFRRRRLRRWYRTGRTDRVALWLLIVALLGRHWRGCSVGGGFELRSQLLVTFVDGSFAKEIFLSVGWKTGW